MIAGFLLPVLRLLHASITMLEIDRPGDSFSSLKLRVGVSSSALDARRVGR